MRVVIHIETDDGEAITGPGVVEVPNDLLSRPPSRQNDGRQNEANMQVTAEFVRQYVQAVEK